MVTQLARSTLTTLPPAIQLAGSLRGTYLSNFAYATFTPGENSSRTKRNGPEPV
ncbi:Uncharacterised protein [Bordetella pertussis]|nr:Uncharacterised protein [Bordetella pertussis]CPL90768.1 Uncharacterised protein [Bordetella pertussis]CPM61798.1 Uncharacterised protein [Bordetella pertussis]